MRQILCCSTILLASALLSSAAGAASPRFVISNSTPGFVATAQKISDVDPAAVIDVTLWLQPHNRMALDSMVHVFTTRPRRTSTWTNYGSPSLFAGKSGRQPEAVAAPAPRPSIARASVGVAGRRPCAFKISPAIATSSALLEASL